MKQKNIEHILSGIRAFAFDVDGVMTDGGILADLEGELFRTFNAKDGFALRMASMHGYALSIITRISMTSAAGIRCSPTRLCT